MGDPRFDIPDIPLTTQLAEVNREIAMRERLYPKWITDGKVTKFKADMALETMRAVAKTLRGLIAEREPPEAA